MEKRREHRARKIEIEDKYEGLAIDKLFYCWSTLLDNIRQSKDYVIFVYSRCFSNSK